MKRRSGFTLVELVVVVLILGILAAVAAPKIINNSSDASDSGVSQTLATVRDAIELYHAQSSVYPTSANAADIHAALDPYLRGTIFPRINVGGISNSNDILMDADDTPTVVTTNGEGWVYSASSGEIIINSDAILASQPSGSIKYSDL